MATTRSVEEYLDLAYSISLSRADDGDWLATVDELSGCEARGTVPEEAAARVHEAMGDWIASALADGKAVPMPRPSLSGRLLVRMPRTLHADLARAAAREQVSLNQFITSALSTAVAWRGSDGALRPPEAPPDGTAQQPRLLRYALVANFVLVAVAALLAIVLLASGN
jgi:antitoxin HicB